MKDGIVVLVNGCISMTFDHVRVKYTTNTINLYSKMVNIKLG